MILTILPVYSRYRQQCPQQGSDGFDGLYVPWPGACDSFFHVFSPCLFFFFTESSLCTNQYQSDRHSPRGDAFYYTAVITDTAIGFRYDTDTAVITRNRRRSRWRYYYGGPK